MNKYYIFKKPKKKNTGDKKQDEAYSDKAYSEAYSIEELKDITLYRNTLISVNNSDDFRKAIEFPELKDIVLQQDDPAYFGYEIVPPKVRMNASTITLSPYFGLLIITILLVRIFHVNDDRLMITFLLFILFYTFFSIYWFKRSCGTIGQSILKIKMISSIDGSDFNDFRKYLTFAVTFKRRRHSNGIQYHIIDEQSKTLTVYKKKEPILKPEYQKEEYSRG